MLEEKVIGCLNSEWTSPMVIIKKNDNILRLCIDYKKLNTETKLDAYPMHRIKDILDQGQAK